MGQRYTRDNMKAPRTRRGEMLTVHPHCLMFFVDETGHEEFADPNHPVFGLGGCAILAAAIENNLRTPWREMKARWFGDPDVSLHAADLRRPTEEQANAIGDFFRKQQIGRFAVTMTKNTKLPEGFKAIQLMPSALRLRRRGEQLAPRFEPVLVEIALIHKASDRGDELLEKYFGESVAIIEGKRVNAHHGIMDKGDEALEVADFIVQAAGRQALFGITPGRRVRRDFDVIFRTNPLWSSFHGIESAA
jgi:hypothetical protein